MPIQFSAVSMSILCRIFFFTTLYALVAGAAWAQDQQQPDNTVQQPNGADQQLNATQPQPAPIYRWRIVNGRPTLYTFKHWINPLTWVEAAFEPLGHSADSGRIHKMANTSRPPKVSGVRFGLGGSSLNSGYGPLVAPYSKDFLKSGVEVEVPLLYTYKQYQLYQLVASVPLVSQGIVERLSFDPAIGYDSRASDNFFGIGDNTPDFKTNYRTVTREASAGFTAKLTDDWAAAIRGVYRDVGVTNPTTGISTQSVFTPATVPGLFGANLGSAVFAVGRNTERRENYAFSGGLDEAQVSFTKSTDGSGFKYWRYYIGSQHFFWLNHDGRKVIAARGLFETNQAPAGFQVPFFDMPFIGSDSTVRGLDNFRYRDTSVVSASLEYRYRIWTAMDWALFVDEGQVGPQPGDFSWGGFHTGYGARFFFWLKPTLPLSVDYGRSGNHWRLYFNFDTRF